MERSKRHHTEQAIDKNLDKMLFLAAEQKLLPKIIYDYSFAHQSPTFANQYRQSVKQIYTKQTSKLLKYNEEEAKTHRQKFRQKILKLINNQLPIDYLKPVKVNEKYVMTYQGHPLEKVQYPTKLEFNMFRDFSEEKFKNGYENVFDDKLEYKQEQIFKEIRRDSKVRSKTKPNQSQFTKQIVKKIQEPVFKHTGIVNQQYALPKLIASTQLDRSRLASPSHKKKPKPFRNTDETALILETMMKIGKYSSSSSAISVTKQSIVKYFRDFYPRPHRIIDFLELNEVETFNTFSRLPLKLKLMPNEHVCFMAFMLYDSNNDGYICINDLLRLEQMAKKCPILHLDYEIIKKQAIKVKYETQLTYTDLYRLSEVTETTYFNWLKKEKLKVENPESASYDSELKGYFQHLNKRKIMVHYEAFKKMFENDKPYIWYDILYRLSGIKYDGLKYE